MLTTENKQAIGIAVTTGAVMALVTRWLWSAGRGSSAAAKGKQQQQKSQQRGADEDGDSTSALTTGSPVTAAAAALNAGSVLCARAALREKYPIYQIAIVGGACSGKSTSMNQLKAAFEAKGFGVFIATEVATILINGGLHFGDLITRRQEIQKEFGLNCVVEAQKLILQNIITLEDTFYKLASMQNRPCIILCDRGTMDGRAYCNEEGDEWREVLKGLGLTNDILRDLRYDAVINLVSAAIGAEKFYTTANNAARTETVEQAAAGDKKVRAAWLGHRTLGVFKNDGAFDVKMQRTVDFIDNFVDPQRKHLNFKYYPIESEQIDLPASQLYGGKKHVVDVCRRTLFPRRFYAEEHVVSRTTDEAEHFYLRARMKSGAVNYVAISAAAAARTLLEREDTSVKPVLRKHTTFIKGLDYYSITTFLKVEDLPTLQGKSFLVAQSTVDAVAELPFLKLGAPLEKMPDVPRKDAFAFSQ